MNYFEVKNLLPNAEFIYVDVTDKELAEIDVPFYQSELEGKVILGTTTPIQELSKKELKAGSVSFG
jgi:hypothetical protein